MSYGRTEENGKDRIIFLEQQGDFNSDQMQFYNQHENNNSDGDYNGNDNNNSNIISTIVSTSSDDKNSLKKKSSGGAIDAETGKVNWDCPCLANALLPPCGSYFKAAFGCFASSKSQPQGVECMEQFAAFRECLALHPDIYYNKKDSEEAGNENDEF